MVPPGGPPNSSSCRMTPACRRRYVDAAVRDAFGRRVDLFSEFAYTQIASASVVYVARVRDGAPVVVKVQHEGATR